MPAWDALEAIDQKIERLSAADDPRPLAADIEALRREPCLALAFEDHLEPLEWKTGLSLRRWWRDGGHRWLEDYASLDDERTRYIATPPSIRKVLSSDTPSPPLLRPILCPLRAADDASCGAESASWLSRAEGSMHNGWSRSSSVEDYCVGMLAYADEHPEHIKPEARAGSRYVRFRTCIDGNADMVDALPLGAFRPPSEGWLFVNRAVFIAQQNCNQNILGFDLATGAAYLRHCLPDRGPPRTEVGRVSRSALRELALMLVFANQVEHDVRLRSQMYTVPLDMAIGRLPGERGGFSGRVTVSTSDSPALVWTWMRAKVPGGPIEGLMSDEADTGEPAPAHADGLLKVVQASFKPGCTPARLPAGIPWAKPGPSLSGTRDYDIAADHFGRMLGTEGDAEKELAKATAAPAATCPIIP
jgi:hypothetical protein